MSHVFHHNRVAFIHDAFGDGPVTILSEATGKSVEVAMDELLHFVGEVMRRGG